MKTKIIGTKKEFGIILKYHEWEIPQENGMYVPKIIPKEKAKHFSMPFQTKENKKEINYSGE